MKKQWFLIHMVWTFLLLACHEVTHPQVDTLFLKAGTSDVHKSEAVSRLFELYSNSKRDKLAYEVISKDARFILNYTPESQLLTLSADLGSGWAIQYRDVSEQKLQKLAAIGYSIDSLGIIEENPVKYDSLLIRNSPIIRVRTSGTP